MKLIVARIGLEIISVSVKEPAEIISELADYSTGTKAELIAMFTALGVEDLSKIEEFEKSNVNMIENEVN